mgnify:CR=1 FL=1
MLYFVATPIGNLDDLSLRQAKAITQSDVILAEDTRSFEILKNKATSSFKLTPNQFQVVESYYKGNEMEKLPLVFNYLSSNKDVAVLSESGMPLISDPGYLLMKTAIAKKIPLTLIPGPTAFTSSVVLSGFNFRNIFFIGFLPKKSSEIKEAFKRISRIKEVMPNTVTVFYESPHRIKKTLELLKIYFPNEEVAIVREISKRFEQVLRGFPDNLAKNTFKGELTVVIK